MNIEQAKCVGNGGLLRNRQPVVGHVKANCCSLQQRSRQQKQRCYPELRLCSKTGQLEHLSWYSFQIRTWLEGLRSNAELDCVTEHLSQADQINKEMPSIRGRIRRLAPTQKYLVKLMVQNSDVLKCGGESY
jgi:hypothetical protein